MDHWTPRNVAEVELALRTYYDDLGRVTSDGYASAPEGSRVQSTRQGRPTEAAAIALLVLPAQVAVVEGWLGSLSPIERRLADWYLLGRQAVQLHELAEAYGWSLTGAWRRVDKLPKQIWERWYRECQPLDSEAEKGENKE